MQITETEEKIIQFIMEHPEELYTLHAASRKMNISYSSVYNNVKKLLDKKILILSNGGYGLLYQKRRKI